MGFLISKGDAKDASRNSAKFPLALPWRLARAGIPARNVRNWLLSANDVDAVEAARIEAGAVERVAGALGARNAPVVIRHLTRGARLAGLVGRGPLAVGAGLADAAGGDLAPLGATRARGLRGVRDVVHRAGDAGVPVGAADELVGAAVVAARARDLRRGAVGAGVRAHRHLARTAGDADGGRVAGRAGQDHASRAPGEGAG